MTVGSHHLHITALRVLDVYDLSIPSPRALGEDIEVMAVKVEGMSGRRIVIDDEADGGVGAKVVDVPLWVVWI